MSKLLEKTGEMELHPESLEDLKQVGHLDPSVASGRSPGSDSRRSKKVKSLSLLRARLREEELQKELELMKARNQVRLAELDLESDSGASEGNEIDCVVKIQGCLNEVGSSTPASQGNAPSSNICMARLDMPKVELEYFDGNPRGYWRFVQQFKYYVEDRVGDSGQRMLYLLHYCRGPAKEAIAECVMLPPNCAYEKARKILKELFGQEHVVARAILDDLLKGLRPIHGDAQALSRLAVSLQNCHIALSQMKYTSDMDSLNTLERILRTLPVDVRKRWARIADEIEISGRSATFLDLWKFVASEARIARSRFGMVALADHQLRHVRQPPRSNLEGPTNSGSACEPRPRRNRGHPDKPKGSL